MNISIGKLNIAALILAAVVALHCAAAEAQTRIAVYDSRSLAIAYTGSGVLQEDMKALKKKLNDAKRSGDQLAIAKVGEEGLLLPLLVFRQGLTGAPLVDLLARIPAEVTRIQNAHGVSQLVSEWDQATLDQHVGAVRVDVTEELVDAFQPSSAGRRNALNARKLRPLPLSDLKACL